jgi:hypothetical protein
MYAMGQAVHVMVVQLILPPLISLPPKAKLNKHPYGNSHSDTSPLSWVVVGSLSCVYVSLLMVFWL